MKVGLQDDEIILQKLQKLKCDKKGCQANVNYIIFEIGIFCTGCFSKQHEVGENQFASLEELSKMITELTKSYKQNKKQGLFLLGLKNEVAKHRKTMEQSRDAVATDAKSIRSKANQIVVRAQESCLKQWRNQALEDIFEPSLTASVLEESKMLLRYMNNLQVVEPQEGKFEYVFRQPGRNPEKAKKEALQKIERVQRVLEEAQNQNLAVMNRFRSSIKE